jgi:hypothetical protein
MIKRSWVFGVLLSILIGGLCAQEKPAPANDPFQLALVLKAAREYSRRLEAAALDFICLEEVSEKVDLSRESREAPIQQAPDLLNQGSGVSSSGGYSAHAGPGRPMSFNPRAGEKTEHSVLYDYQFVRRVGKIKEKRTLLERDGKKVHPDAAVPANKAFNYSDILLAPVQLLDDRFSEFYSYRLVGKETVGDAEAWVLEVTPRLSGVARYLGAKLWLKADDSSVLRIEWDPSTFGNYEAILARAKAFKAEPELRSVTEFGVEKNGLRFPSADLTEEAYRGGDGKLFVRARTSVAYKDHKFFTVETEATFKK